MCFFRFMRAFRTIEMLGLMIVAGIGSPAVHGGTVIFVHDDAPLGGDGANWDTAYRFLQDAIAFASDPRYDVTEIHVGQGIYRPDRDEANPSGTGDRLATFQLINGVALMGGYAGIGAPDPDARDIALYVTICSGDLLGNDGPNFENNGENSYHVTTGSGTDDSAVLDGFTITAGNANDSFPNNRGAGCIALEAFFTVRDCHFKANAAEAGGAVYNSGSDPSITDCVFEDNLAGAEGAGMFNDSSRPTIIGCDFLGNTVSRGSGGAMRNLNGSDATITNCLFNGNSATSQGAGVSNSSSSPFFSNCTFINNTGVSSGGGMHNLQSSPWIVNCMFSNNFAIGGGAINNNDSSSPLIENCTFQSNSAGVGGALANGGNCNPVVLDCQFNSNEALSTHGGAIANGNTDLYVENCSFWNNSARLRGGAVHNSGDSNTAFVNCVFTGNSGWIPGSPIGYGGAVYNHTATISLLNCSFFFNTARDSAAALYNWAGTMVAHNCLLIGNEVIQEPGGALFNTEDGVVSMSNCTLVDNCAPAGGGGVYGTSGLISLTSCIVWNNIPDQASGGAVSVNYSCIMDGFDGEGNISMDPSFVNPRSDNYRLLPGSPSIDAGDNRAVPPDEFDLDSDGDITEPIPFDLDRNPRFLNDGMTQDTGNGVPPITDMGAYEFVSDCNDNGIPDYIDIRNGVSKDCNDNHVPDECEIEEFDCNNNGVPDDCDIADGTSKDADEDGIPDECRLDCNNNGVPDSIDISDGTSEDCNGNGIPDECDVAQPFFAESGQLGPIGFDSAQSFVVASPPSAADDVSLTFTAVADLLSVIEFIDVDINGVAIGSVFAEGAQDCPKTPDADEIIIPADVYNDAVGGGDALITMTATNAVNPLACEGSNYITVALHYSLGGMSDDDNNNGIPDECETPGDLNGDGTVGVDDLLILLGNWGPCADCDDCVADLDGDCSVGVKDLLILLGNWG